MYWIYTIFNKINKATHVRSRAVYRLKLITRARSINDRFLAPIYTYCDVIGSVATLNTGFFFAENDLDFGQLWANLCPIYL